MHRPLLLLVDTGGGGQGGRPAGARVRVGEGREPLSFIAFLALAEGEEVHRTGLLLVDAGTSCLRVRRLAAVEEHKC